MNLQQGIASECWMISSETRWAPSKRTSIPLRWSSCLCSLWCPDRRIFHRYPRNAIQIKLCAYVLPLTPITFLLGLPDQRRPGFDIILCERNSSHLRISSWDRVFPLTVTSHFLLRFKPISSFSLKSPDWNEILSRSMFEKKTAQTHSIDYNMTYVVLHDARPQD